MRRLVIVPVNILGEEQVKDETVDAKVTDEFKYQGGSTNSGTAQSQEKKRNQKVPNF